jgi:hypothetical protein
VLGALGGAGGDDQALGSLLAGLARREFVFHRAARPPIVLRSRFAMSYLRGPLTRADLGRLVERGLVARPPDVKDRVQEEKAAARAGSRPPPGAGSRRLAGPGRASCRHTRALPGAGAAALATAAAAIRPSPGPRLRRPASRRLPCSSPPAWRSADDAALKLEHRSPYASGFPPATAR